MNGTPKQIINFLLEQDPNKKFEIKEYKEKRSLDANAYYWVLINKIANALNRSKEWVHVCMLKRYGVTYAVPAFEGFDIARMIKYYEYDGTRKMPNGRIIKCYKAYLPSSEMNTKEMSVLIDGVVSECHEMGIETMTPNELEEIKANWG